MKQVTGNTALVPSDEVVDIVDYKWRRLPGETIIAYNYFKLYLSIPAPRSIGRTAIKARVERTTLATYSAKYKWLERAAAFDDNESDRELAKIRRHREKQDLLWAARRDEQREAEWNIAEALLKKVRQMLEVPLFKQTVTETLDKVDEKGRIIIRQIIVNEPLDWSATDMARFFEVASKMARLATGMDTDRKRIKIDVSVMSDEELEALANEG